MAKDTSSGKTSSSINCPH